LRKWLSLPSRGRQALRSVRLGLVRRWFCSAYATYWFYLRFGVQPATLGVIFFWANLFAGYFRAPGGASRCTLGLGQHDGPHASSFQYSAHSCPADAQSLACGSGAPSTIQHQSDGRSYAAVLHGGGEQGRAIRGRRNHGRGPHNGSGHQSLFVGFMFARTSWVNVPFFLAGALKVLFDLLLSKEFVGIQPVEERR
jgi:hypothetical protein